MRNHLVGFLPALAALLLSGCSVTWVEHPEAVAKDGSRIVVTTFDWVHGRDSLVIERYDREGNRSVHTVEDLPDNFRSFTSETSVDSVILRLLDADNRVIDKRNIPFDSFTPKGR